MAREFKYVEDMYETLKKEVEQRRENEDRVGAKPSAADVIDVLSVDLNIAQNGVDHHTSDYEVSRSEPMRLVVRRGQEFRLILHCSRPFDPDADALIVQLDFGSEPTLERLTRRLLKVSPEGTAPDWRWGARVAGASQNTVTILVQSSASAQVGAWRLRVEAGRRRNGAVRDTYLAYAHPAFLFLLFNPWSQEDAVYVADEAEREAYVLADHGTLWTGAKSGQYTACPWNFDQFEDVALFSALVCLRSGRYLADSERGDAALVARRLTACINDSVLAGRWVAPYDEGTPPWEWTGSFPILRAYMENPDAPVKYGQCWVFSAVLLTLCRSLGLPCRSVTNIRSAHDTDKSLTVDHVFMKNEASGGFDEVRPGAGKDSIWNFHVWNEIWCERPDLPPGYDGWQALDATPQEMSQGRYQCGPMPVAAIRKGEVDIPYDGWFIYGEVNADVVRWYYTPDPASPLRKRLLKAYTDTTDVGRAVITSAVGEASEAVDITADYKAPEGSEAERNQIRHAVRKNVAQERAEIADLFKLKDHSDDVRFTFTDLEMVKFGDPIESTLEMVNQSTKERTIVAHLNLMVLSYTGVTHKKVLSAVETITLKPKASQSFVLQATGRDYSASVMEHAQMAVEATATVTETEQVFAERDVFQLDKPALVLESTGWGRVNQPTTVRIHFTNPSNVVLSDCRLRLEGAGLSLAPLSLRCPSTVAGMGGFSVSQSVVPKRPGKRGLVAVFNADRLANIRGSCNIHVSG